MDRNLEHVFNCPCNLLKIQLNARTGDHVMCVSKLRKQINFFFSPVYWTINYSILPSTYFSIVQQFDYITFASSAILASFLLWNRLQAYCIKNTASFLFFWRAYNQNNKIIKNKIKSHPLSWRKKITITCRIIDNLNCQL